MLLRVSGTQTQTDYDIAAVNDPTLDSGVEHGTWILQLTDGLIKDRLGSSTHCEK